MVWWGAWKQSAASLATACHYNQDAWAYLITAHSASGKHTECIKLFDSLLKVLHGGENMKSPFVCAMVVAHGRAGVISEESRAMELVSVIIKNLIKTIETEKPVDFYRFDYMSDCFDAIIEACFLARNKKPGS